MSFESPIWLWSALLAIPAGLAAVRLLTSMVLIRRWSAAVARAVLIALLAMTLAGAASVRRTQRLAVIAVIDASASVLRFGAATDEGGRTIAAMDRARAWLAQSSRQRGPEDLLGVVVFDGQALAIAAPTAGDPLGRGLEPVGVEGSDIAAAVRLARSLIPADAAGRLVLISDGNQTTGDALGQAREASAAGTLRGVVPIDTVAVEYALTREVFIESVDAPPTAAAGAPITLRVVLVSTGASRGVLRVLENDVPIDASPGVEGDALALEIEGGRTVVRVPVTPGSARTHRFTAIYEPEVLESGVRVALSGDTDVANNRGEAFTVTPGTGSILVLDGDGQGNPAGGGATLAEVWREAGLVVRLASPDAMPRSLLELQAHDLVVLQNVPADALGREGMELLSSYVRDLGGGLLTLGGRESYGAGGWKGSPLEALLPVSLDLPERLLAPEVAVVIVMDRSGSMAWRVQGSGRSQQDIANEAAATAVRSLEPNDLVGVITFNLAHEVVVPLAPNSDPEGTARKVLAISPEGGTAVGGALQEAGRQLSQATAKTKHIIVLSDGQSMDADVLPDLARTLRNEGITISTIAVGDGAHIQSMQSVAYYGGGTFYEVINPSVLPRVFLKAIRVIRTPLVREGFFEPAMTSSPSPLVRGIGTELPPLLGMNLTQARSDATVSTPMVSPDGEPVLAHWQVELGQVVSFTSDAWRWGEPWLGWESYRTLWTQAARLASRAPGTRGLSLSSVISGGRLSIRLDATGDDGRPLDLLHVDAAVFSPDGTQRDVRLTQSGPGLYEASLEADRGGTWVVVAKPRRGEQRLSPVVAGTAAADAREFRRLSSDSDLLRQIATATGGRVYTLDEPAGGLFDRSGIEPVRASTPLWPVLVGWTLAVLLLDVGTRRVAWDRLVSRELRGRSVLESMADATRDRGRAAVASLGVLAGRRAAGSGVAADALRTSPGPLTEADAMDAAREALERRRAERIAAARASMREDESQAARTSPGAGTDAASHERERPGSSAEDPNESPLMRAKRRAQQRLDGEGGA